MGKSNKGFPLSCKRAEKLLCRLGIKFSKVRLKNDLGFQLKIEKSGFEGIFINAYDNGNLYTQGNDDMMLFLINGILKLRSDYLLEKGGK